MSAHPVINNTNPITNSAIDAVNVFHPTLSVLTVMKWSDLSESDANRIDSMNASEGGRLPSWPLIRRLIQPFSGMLD